MTTPGPPVPPDDLPRSPSGRVPRWVIDDAAARATGVAAPGTSWLPGELPPPSSVPPPPPPARDTYPMPGPAPSFPAVPPAYPTAAPSYPHVPLGRADGPWREPPRPTRSFSLGRTLRLLVVGLVIVGMVAGLTGRLRDLGFTLRPEDLVADDGARVTYGVPVDWPSPARGASPTPLASPPVVANPSPSYAFVRTQADGVRPVAFDPCRPVTYVVRTDGQPEGADRLIAEAVAQVSQATGLVFVAEGVTSEAPQPERPPTDFERYGDRWSPVLIAWQTEAEEPALAGSTVGQGGGTSVSRGTVVGTTTPEVFVTGQVVLDSEDLGRLMRQGAEGESAVRAVIMHELAHVVGLDHVADSSQLMNPTQMRGVQTFADGDLTGLAALGAGECVPGL